MVTQTASVSSGSGDSDLSEVWTRCCWTFSVVRYDETRLCTNGFSDIFRRSLVLLSQAMSDSTLKERVGVLALRCSITALSPCPLHSSFFQNPSDGHGSFNEFSAITADSSDPRVPRRAEQAYHSGPIETPSDLQAELNALLSCF